ncbi:sensor histidine kinase [Spartinivicinus poritis]|uniref:histidine kinase n=1 Tax=Spartinivicinus poritis TaxID=2994640 RepID=A0ABT5UHZ1_9GAMM|nr:HAMP domain-containing sensor histidine kinase [Spartinivicinus sp. A2-2]MDE1465980.1 HAMP domain-containing sensor histidine kinase [Spartinivicinus sp. A2-2]
MAESWIEVISQQEVQSLQLKQQPRLLLLGWREHELVLQQGDVAFAKPNKKETYIANFNNHKWVISTVCQNNACVLVGLRDSERKNAVWGLVILIFVPLLIMFGLAMLAMHYAVQSGLQPLNLLAQHVSSVSIEKLPPLPESSILKELLPLVHALNQLINNMKAQLLKERQFLDTCTHELRTPVTALIAQMQSLGYLNNDNANSDFHKVNNAALRVVRVANQFLSLAKTNNATALENQCEKFDLCELFRQVIADLIIDHSHCDCQMKGSNSIMVFADPLAMEMVCRNLIENALRYGTNVESGKVHIQFTCELENGQVKVTVEDAGPGVMEKYREKLVQRFYRIAGHNTQGAGLGLSIINEIATYYDGSVIIGESRLGGLKVVVWLNNILN